MTALHACSRLAVVGVALLGSACAQQQGQPRQIENYSVVVDEAADTLLIHAEPCGELRVSTAESADEVRLTVWLLNGGDCIGSDSPPVSLTHPLGARTVVDDRTGRDIITTALDTGPDSFYLDDIDPASVASIRVPTNDGYVVAHVAAPPNGGPGVCMVDAFGTLPGRVMCITPGADRTLVVPLRSEGQPTVFMDERVARVTLRSDREPERELLVMDVPGVALARITQATTEVGIETDVDATLAFYDSSGRELTLAAFHPPDE